jgi:hypothetical protein
MLGSPWTMNLCALLKAALGDIDEQDPFAVVLKDRLKNCGAELLDQVGIGSPLCLPCRSRRLITFAKIARAVRSEGSSSTSSGTKKVRGTADRNRPPLIAHQKAKTW